MTQEELLGQLRDIHLPAETTVAPILGFSLWPIIAFALAIGSGRSSRSPSQSALSLSPGIGAVRHGGGRRARR